MHDSLVRVILGKPVAAGSFNHGVVVMQKRHVYALLFGIPGLFLALILTLLVFGAVSGFLWLYLFGDNPWPKASEQLLTSLAAAMFLALWTATVVLGYLTGKRLETSPGLNRQHVVASAALTIAPVLLLVLHQWSVGNLGPRTDSLACRDLCLAKGYPASGMPPKDSGERVCICYDSGQEVLRVPMDVSRYGQ
jgi:hypothetical protein